MKKLILFLFTAFPFLSPAQNWRLFPQSDTVIYEVFDDILTQANLLPLVDGINVAAPDFEMNPLYGLRVTSMGQTQDSTFKWKMKPVNNLLYIQATGFIGATGEGRFPLEEATQKNDSIVLKTGNTSIFVSLGAQQNVPFLSGSFGANNLFLVLDSIYEVNDNGTIDSLAQFRALVYDAQSNPQASHYLNDKKLVVISRNKGLVFFPDLSFLQNRFVPFSLKEYNEPLMEEIFNFEVGDLFWFYNGNNSYNGIYYHTLNEIISKVETADTITYTEKITKEFTGEVSYNDIVVVKNTPIRDAISSSFPYPTVNVPLAIDSITYGQSSGMLVNDWTYIHGPAELQHRRMLMMPDYEPVLVFMDNCGDTKMYIQGVGYLYKRCLMMPTNNPNPNAPGYEKRYYQKILIAYEKTNGDSYRLIPSNWDVENQQLSFFSIAPNPCQGQFSVFNTSGGTVKATLVNMFGKTIIRDIELKASGSNIINIDHLSTGVYFLRITLSNGVRTTEKIIKQN